MKEMLHTRKQYIELIKRELLGPGSEISIPDAEHELVSVTPNRRYSIGILFPQENRLNADNDDVDRQENSEIGEDIVVDEDVETGSVRNESRAGGDEDIPIEEDNLDEEIGLSTQNMPSSMGLTFFVKGNADVINCDVTFATYHAARVSDAKTPFYPENPETYEVPLYLSSFVRYEKETDCLRLKGALKRSRIRSLREEFPLPDGEFGMYDALYKLSDQSQNGYVRDPHKVQVTLNFGDNDYIDDNKALDDTTAKLTALRRKVGEDIFSVTVMLVNDHKGRAAGHNCIFQPEIRVETASNGFTFVDYAAVSSATAQDEEELSLNLQYRNKLNYASGLGTSANWKIDTDGRGTLFTDFFPEVEVPGMDFNLPSDSAVDGKALSMKYLSDLTDDEKGDKLRHLKSVVFAYGNWIKKQELRLDDSNDVPGVYSVIARKHIDNCTAAYERMLSGIQTLDEDAQAWDAFALANRAMYMQRAHLKLQEELAKVTTDRFRGDEDIEEFFDEVDYYTVDERIKDRYAWRPFQIAFILMSIDSIVKDTGDDRELVDLIWFPTGGGKTEAYLGLTAFTIFYRRLSHPNESSGTAVIMRYTLRLLAAQQFTRASTLICACEYIRRDAIERRPIYGKYPLGKEPITIGLWIGGEHTPNSNDDAKKHEKKLRDATAFSLRDTKNKHNKFQVLKCPWCGTKLVQEVDGKKKKGNWGYRMSTGHFELFCPHESCDFTGKLPIQVVDEELYREPPTLLFGTVDKFAMLPWNDDIGNFFALNSNNRTPELIIQDELHLISGPLGTMVGLYETAVDMLCASKGVKTKIVASTATIRRAKEQCSALYNRPVAQFPPPGLDSDDSFFARELPIDYDKETFGRTYVGLMPSGKTKAMMEIRSIAALMQTINVMELPDEIKDKYWTLTTYFNSLKDLGKCSTLVDDDVKDFIKRMAFRVGTAKKARMITRADELTSRVSTTELNETLDKLERLEYSQENVENKRYASNILLATNMISVGIDVARLNVMLMIGQPKLTSEYIQASSRVGRRYPGVAFVMYDGSKSRDRSHYEQFKPYHESFYKYVEPTGATPFSKPARERALHAIVISLLRMLEPGLSGEGAAENFSRDQFEDRVVEIKNYILKRNSEIVARLDETMDDDNKLISDEIDSIIEDWERMAAVYDEGQFYYGKRFMVAPPENGMGRLMKVFGTAPTDSAKETMTSMRNVDSTVAGNVLIWED